MKIILTILGFGYSLVLSQSAMGQRSPGGLPLRLSLLQKTASLPSINRLTSSLNPGVSIGTELYYKQGKKHQWFQTVNLSGIYHKELATSLLITSEVSYRFLAGKINLDLKLGPGYLLNKSAAPLYQYEDEGYTKTSGLQHRLVATAGLSLGIKTGPVTPFVGYSMLIETPFMQNNSVFLPHQVLQIGLATQINRSTSR